MVDAAPRGRLKAAGQASAEDPRRSPLFHWLKKNRRAIPPPEGARRDWRPLLAKANAAGVTDGAGKPPTARRMQLAWREVERFIAVRQAQAADGTDASPRGRHSSGLPKDLKAPVLREARRPAGQAPAPSGSAAQPAMPAALPVLPGVLTAPAAHPDVDPNDPISRFEFLLDKRSGIRNQQGEKL